MKKSSLLFACCLLAGATAFAQIQVGGFASNMKGTGDNTANLWGGGAHLKFFAGKNMALGASLRTYPKTTTQTVVDGTTYSTSDLLTNLTGTFDMLLAKNTRPIQPYIGADAGLSFSNRIVAGADNGTQSVTNENKQTFFLLSPKAGINIGLGRTLGIFGQAQYNMTFGEGDPMNVGTIPNPIQTKPVDKYFSFDAGIYVRLVGAGKASK